MIWIIMSTLWLFFTLISLTTSETNKETNQLNEWWTDKFCPDCFDDYIFEYSLLYDRQFPRFPEYISCIMCKFHDTALCKKLLIVYHSNKFYILQCNHSQMTGSQANFFGLFCFSVVFFLNTNFSLDNHRNLQLHQKYGRLSNSFCKFSWHQSYTHWLCSLWNNDDMIVTMM